MRFSKKAGSNMRSWLEAPTTMSLMQTASALPQQSPNDIVMSGKYQIELCGQQTPNVKQALDNLWAAIQPAIATTNYASSNPTYAAFFHDSIHGPLVQQVLQNVSEGAAVPKRVSQTPVSPLIACVTNPGIVIAETGGVVQDMWDACSNNLGWAAFTNTETNWIFLCPFFNQLLAQPSPNVCPGVANNQFGSLWGYLV